MSSVHIDGSGARPLTFTMNDPARTSAQFSTKPDDDLTLTVSGANGVLDMVVVPSLVHVERIVDGDYTRLRLRITGGVTGAVFTKVDPEGHGWPHASIGARKDAPRQLADAEAVQLGTLEDAVVVSGAIRAALVGLDVSALSADDQARVNAALLALP